MSLPKVLWSAAKTAGGFIVGATSVFGWMNITPEMVGQAAYDALYILLPLITFAGGALFGWGIASIRYGRRLAAMDAGKISGTARSAAGVSADWPGGEAPDGPGGGGAATGVPGLTPIEAELAVEVYRTGALRVGANWLQPAKLLKSRGVIYRLDAPSSGVIEECDVALTDEWRDKVGRAAGAGSSGTIPAPDSEELIA